MFSSGAVGEGSGRLELSSVLACVARMGVVSYGDGQPSGGSGPQGCGSMYKHVAHVIGSGEISVLKCLD